MIGTRQTDGGGSTALQEIDGGRRTVRLRRGEAATAFDRDGFLIMPDLLDPALLASARAETVAICRGERGDVDGVVPADRREDDDNVLRRYLCIHFPHKISSRARDLAALPAAVDVLTDVIGPNVKMMQSMLFIKSEGKPGQAWHQDETHIPTRDRSLTAVWIALDDATVENGCLRVIPGSHRAGVLYPDRVQDDPRYDCTREAYGFRYREEDAVPVELPAGAALVFDGYLLHRSLPNTGRHGMRRALVNHYMSAESLLPWFRPAEGEPMGTVDHRDVVLVAGEDPYDFPRDGRCDASAHPTRRRGWMPALTFGRSSHRILLDNRTYVRYGGHLLPRDRMRSGCPHNRN